MVFEDEIDRWQVIERLVWSVEIVLDKPFGQTFVELYRVSGHVAEGEKLVLKRPVEPFIDRIVLRCLHS